MHQRLECILIEIAICEWLKIVKQLFKFEFVSTYLEIEATFKCCGSSIEPYTHWEELKILKANRFFKAFPWDSSHSNGREIK